ncbi:MAG: Holliday junction branch migration protein RuvA [Varibaculum sp.]|nr:Holliday junction branch migration protein RuvA [Varibaculum sp.]
MIDSVHGEVLRVKSDQIVVVVNGIGFAINSSANSTAEVHAGQEVKLATKMIVKEDDISLYGFTSTDERDVFTTLIGVNGIGPRNALAALSALGPDGLRTAVATKDENAIVKIPGVGKKTAQRLLIELQDKLGEPNGDFVPTAVPDGAVNTEVVQALIGLGWSKQLAESAVVRAAEQNGTENEPALLRVALQILGGARG